MNMKKIIIVNNNMKVGGVQKSLYNLLWTLDGQYVISLLLFSPAGEYMDKLPRSVKVLTCDSLFRYLGVSQGECGNKLTRGSLAALCRVFGRPAVMKLLLASQKMVPGHYDCAISFLQNGRKSNFYGGIQEFVLRRIDAGRKAAFLHCDYSLCGANYPENNRLLAEFDRIAACSEGCRETFCRTVPELAEKSVTVRNCHRYDEIRALAQAEPVAYDPDVCNVVMVSRLAHEKGIERAVAAVKYCRETGIPVTLHIVGGGPMRVMLEETVKNSAMSEHVRFYGEQGNPYRYLANADLFLMTSFHEAAPMVIEEAACLGIPVLTTRTTSSDEMVTRRECGWVCGNTQQGIDEALLRVVKDAAALRQKKALLQSRHMDNSEAIRQFSALIEG